MNETVLPGLLNPFTQLIIPGLAPIAAAVSIIGGIAGILSFLWIVRRKIWGKVKVLNSRAHIHSLEMDPKQAQFAFIGIEAYVTVANKTDAPVAITDIIGTLRYDHTEYKKSELIKSGIPERFSFKPTSISPYLPINLAPNETNEIQIHFETRAELFALERCYSARLVGFHQDIPIVFGVTKHEENDPFRMLVTLDAGGKDVSYETPVFRTEEEMRKYGTISVVRQAMIEKKW